MSRMFLVPMGNRLRVGCRIVLLAEWCYYDQLIDVTVSHGQMYKVSGKRRGYQMQSDYTCCRCYTMVRAS